MTTESPEAGSVTPEPLMQMMQGMHLTAILQAGARLGIFDHITDGNTDAATIAVQGGADERGTRILLDALAAPGCWRKTVAIGCLRSLTHSWCPAAPATSAG